MDSERSEQSVAKRQMSRHSSKNGSRHTTETGISLTKVPDCTNQLPIPYEPPSIPGEVKLVNELTAIKWVLRD